MHLASQQGATSVFEPDAIGSSTSRDVQPDNAHSVQRVPDLDVGRRRDVATDDAGLRHDPVADRRRRARRMQRTIDRAPQVRQWTDVLGVGELRRATGSERGSLAAYYWTFEPPEKERPRRFTKAALMKLSQTPTSARPVTTWPAINARPWAGGYLPW